MEFAQIKNKFTHQFVVYGKTCYLFNFYACAEIKMSK